MDDNKDAIKALIERDADKNFRPSLLYGLNDAGKAALTDKKYNVTTRFDTSTAIGPIKKGQFFKIHLDKQLTIKDEDTLKPIKNDNEIIAEPKYDKTTNTITYTIAKDITDNIQVPLNIPADYDADKINLDEDGNFTIKNSISGLGVVDPKPLPPEKVNKQGEKIGVDPNNLNEKGLHNTNYFFDPSSTYKVNFDAKASPVIENGEIKAIEWEITFDGTGQNLGSRDLDLITNFTAVKGSGIKEIKDIKLNGKPITDIEDNNMGDKFLINDSKNISPTKGTKYVYTFTTEVTNKQEAYVIDINGVLRGKNKTGAVRLVQKGYELEKVYAETSSRISTTNRVTNKGEFIGNNKIRWMVTEEISSGDKGSLPLVQRKLSSNQNLQSLKVSYYAPNENGKMVQVEDTQDLTNSYPLAEGSLAKQNHKTGTIAVYEYITNVTANDKNGYSLGDNTVSEYGDMDIHIKWSTIEGQNPPTEKITLTSKDGKNTATLDVPANIPVEYDTKVLNVKKWEIGQDGTATPIAYNLSQQLPADKPENGKTYSYKQINVSYDPHERRFEVRNAIAEVTESKDAEISIKKTDADNGQALEGAKIQLVGNSQTYGATTDSEGKITFSNLKPGKYILSESQAPPGYIRDTGQDIITVNNDGTVSWSTNNLIQNQPVSENTEGLVDRYTSAVAKRLSPDNTLNAGYFMNTESYTTYEDGHVVSYIMLKPDAHPEKPNGTDKDTKINIKPTNIDIEGIEIYNIEPSVNKGFFRNAIERGYLGSWQDFMDANLKMNIPYRGGTENNSSQGLFTRLKTSLNSDGTATVNIPKSRFNNDWSYIIKVNGNVKDKNVAADVVYDWLTKDNPDTNWGLRNIKNPIPSKAERDKQREENSRVENAEFLIHNKSSKTHPVKVTKKDRNGNPLAGAEFMMTDSYGNIVKRGKTDANGLIEFSDLPQGIYNLKEINPPEGYKNDDISFEVKVSRTGQILYEAFDKDGNKIAPGDKYLVGKQQGPSTSGPPSESKIEVISKSMTLNEGSRWGTKPGVWEEPAYESYDFKLELNIRNKKGGDMFTINFDKNWNLSQWTDKIPDIKDNVGNVIARANMDYTNNVLTYTLTDHVTGKDNIRASMQVKGVRPSKYYVKQDGIYYFTDTINTGDTVATTQTRVDAYLGEYFGTRGELRYITQNVDVYNVGTQQNPQYEMRDVTVYNPDGLHPAGDRVIRIFYGATKDPNPTVFNNKIAPAHKPTKVVVWKVARPNLDNLPVSGGIKPASDPSIYTKVAEFNVSNTDQLNTLQNGIGFSYDEKRGGPDKTPQGLNKIDNVQFKITLPDDNGAGYVIENFYRVNDENQFRTTYTQTIAGYKGRYGNTMGIAQFKPNPNIASSSSGTSIDVEEPNYDLTVFNKKSDKGKFTLTKYGKEANGEKILPQAYFKLVDKDGKLVKEDYTSPSGTITFDNLDPGTYTLTETKAPEGYKPIAKPITVKVSPEGMVTFEGEGIGNGGPYTVTTPKTPDVKIERYEQKEIFNTNPYPNFMNMSDELKSTDGNQIIGRIYLNPKKDDNLGKGPDRPTNFVIKHNWASEVQVQVYRYPESQKHLINTEYLNRNYLVKDSNVKVNQSNYETTISIPTGANGSRWNGDAYVVVALAKFAPDQQNRYISYQWRSGNDPTVLPKKPNNLGTKKIVPDFPPGEIKAVNEKPDTEIIIKKVDDDNKETVLKGAEFTLLDSTLTKVLTQSTTGEDGLAKFEDLAPGTYYIKETKVPEGYKDPNKRWKVVVAEDKSVTITPQTITPSEAGPTPGEGTNPETQKPPSPPTDNGLSYSIKNYDKTGVLYNGNFAGRMGSTLTETSTKGVFELSVDFERAYGIKNQPTEIKIQFDTDRFDIKPAEESLNGQIYTVNNFDPYYGNGNASYKFTVVPKKVTAGFTGSPIKYTSFAGEVIYPEHAKITATKKVAFNFFNILRPTTVYAAGEGNTSAFVPVDSSRSTNATTRGDANASTQITQIDKANKKYRQVFIVNKTGNAYLNDPEFQIHSWPEDNGVNIGQNFKVISVKPVSKSSTPTNIQGAGNELTLNSQQTKMVNGQNRFYFKASGLPKQYYYGAVAVEVEYTYPSSGPIGLGMDFKPNIEADIQWTAQQYPSPYEINKKAEVTYKEIERESIIPIPTEPIKRPNPNMIEGTENIVFEGSTGRKLDTYRQKYVGDRPEGEEELLKSEILTPAQPKIIEYGTRKQVATRAESKDVKQEIKYETTTLVDANKKKGEKTTITKGENGSVTYKYTIIYEKSEGVNAERPTDWPEDAPKASPRTGERVLSYLKEEVPNTRTEPTTEVVSIGLGIDPNEAVEDDTPQKLMPDENKQILYTITNKKSENEITFKKVDATDKTKTLEKAEFEVWYKKEKAGEYSKTELKLYEKTADGKGVDRIVLKDGETAPEGYTAVDKFTTGKDGLVKFKIYEQGYYALKETKAPKGYIRPRDYVKEFVVKDGEIKVKDNKPQVGENMPSDQPEYVDMKDNKSIEVVNHKSLFPHTGGWGIIGFLVAVL